MHPLEKKVKKTLQQEQLLDPGDRVLVAVSAGPDSMALLHLLARLAETGDFSIIAAYVNHGLRPAETAREEELVGRRTAELNIPCVIGRVAAREHAANNGLSLEHAARDLRYAFLDRTAAREQAGKIGLAHTADDQAEELLIRLIRGTGRAGLAGMKTLRAGRYIRPLLTIPKDELLRYLDDREIPWLKDSSNQDRSLLRNRVRQELLPFLAQRFNPNIRETLLRTATILQDEESLLSELGNRAATGIFSQLTDREKSAKDSPPPPLTLDLDQLREQPRAIQRRLLETACWRMDTRPAFRVIAQLLELIDRQRSTSSLHLANGLRARMEGDRLHFSFPRGQGRLRGELSPVPDRAGWQLAIPAPGTYPVTELGRSLCIDCPDLPLADVFAGRVDGDFLDFHRVIFPLVLRPPLPGDRFHPLGGPGRQKLGDFFTNLKMDRQKRRQAAVLLAADTIIALPGLRIDHYFRVRPDTTRLLRLRWQPLYGCTRMVEKQKIIRVNPCHPCK